MLIEKLCCVQRIPSKFTRLNGGDLSNPMFLKPPDGTEWKISHSELDGAIWFDEGFNEFAKYYSLDHGHMLLFEDKGGPHFGIHIFDKSTLEIQYPGHNPKMPPRKKAKRKSPISSSLHISD